MDIGILNIGDELLAGKIVNTNQHDIATLVTPLGHRVAYGLVVGDSGPAIATALEATLGIPSHAARTAKEPSRPADLSTADRTAAHPAIPAVWPAVDVLILTGGLGPTRDDITRDAVAAWLGVGVVEHPLALEWLSAFLGRPAQDLPPGQRVQASAPAGAEPLRNPAGTACGFRFRAGRTEVYAFPGVPKELKAMAALHLLPSLSGDRVFLARGLWTWGWSEGAQREALASVRIPDPFLFSSLPGEKGVRISLQAAVPSPEADHRQAELDLAWSAIVAAIPSEHIVDPQGLSLPEIVLALLKSRGETVAVAESCTGGGLAYLLTEQPGSSAAFDRGFLTYANKAKIDLLGVPADLLEAHGAVSEETALAMALGCRERSGATYACAITGIAGPDGGTADKPVGTVWISVVSRVASHARCFHFRGDRQTVRQRSAYSALNQLRLFIQGKLL